MTQHSQDDLWRDFPKTARMVSGRRVTSCSMTRAAIRPTPLVLRRLWRKAYSSR
jgi:hypothetical protein